MPRVLALDSLAKGLDGMPVVAPDVARELGGRTSMTASRRELDGAMATLGYQIGWLGRIEFYWKRPPAVGRLRQT